MHRFANSWISGNSRACAYRVCSIFRDTRGLPGAQAVVIEQTEIDLWPATHTHRHDPNTSLAAAERVELTGAAQRHMEIITNALTRLGGAGTSKEISAESGLEYMQVVRRMSDLVARDVVEDYSHMPRELRPVRDGYTLWRLR
jgi:hypothetical protein